jgi:hypothetical protein
MLAEVPDGALDLVFRDGVDAEEAAFEGADGSGTPFDEDEDGALHVSGLDDFHTSSPTAS